ncbi:MAG: hypothetical protein FWF59_06680 [Turicibacter sp.]|nr:hypothetical protein [Turicibacter sp.]
MWEDTKGGYTANLITKNKEQVIAQIDRHKQQCVVCRPNGIQQVVCGVRDNKVKIWNDQVFDPGVTNLIKAKMEATVLKKPVDNKKKR